MCMIDYGETADVFIAEQRKARKAHQCSECERMIEPGEQYSHSRWLYDGYWESSATCQHCNAAAKWLVKVCGGWLIGGLSEDLEEHRDEGYNRRWLSIALSGIRRKWRRPDGTPWRPMKLPKNLPVGV